MEAPQLILSAFLSLVIFLSGFWLSRKGKPYSMFIQAVHKLVGVGLGVSLTLAVYYKYQVVHLSSLEIIMVAMTVALFAGLVATGALLTPRKKCCRALPSLTRSCLTWRLFLLVY